MLSFFPSQSSTLVFHHSHMEATKIYTICRHLNKPTPIRVWLYHRNPRISEWIQPAVIIWSSSGTLESVDREEPGVAGGDPRRAPHVLTPPPVGTFVIANALHSQIAPFTAPPASNPVQIYVISVGSSSAGHSSCSIFNSQAGSFSSRMTFTLYCRLYKEKLMNLTPPFFLTGRWGGGLITSVLIFPAAETERLHWFRIAFSPPLLSAKAISRRNTL